MGDFNQVVDPQEKKGGRPVSFYHIRPLQDMIDQCQQVYMGIDGPRFTWSNMRKGVENI